MAMAEYPEKNSQQYKNRTQSHGYSRHFHYYTTDYAYVYTKMVTGIQAQKVQRTYCGRNQQHLIAKNKWAAHIGSFAFV